MGKSKYVAHIDLVEQMTVYEMVEYLVDHSPKIRKHSNDPRRFFLDRRPVELMFLVRDVMNGEKDDRHYRRPSVEISLPEQPC